MLKKVTYDLSEEDMSDIKSETKYEVSTPSTSNNRKNKSYSSPTDLSSQTKTKVSKDVIFTKKTHIHPNNVLLLIVTMKL